MKNISFLLLLLSGLILTSCSNEGLDITDDEVLSIPQRGSMTIEGSDGDIDLILGDITMGSMSVKIKSIEEDKLYLKTNLKEGEEAVFKYNDNNYYRIMINSFEEHVFHDDIAFISFHKVSVEKGKAEAPEITKYKETSITGDEIRKYFDKIKNSGLQFIRNAEIYEDSAFAAHLEGKYILNQVDIKTKEDFFEKIVNTSMFTNETYKVIAGSDTLFLKDWLEKQSGE